MKFLIIVSIVFTLVACSSDNPLSKAKQDYACRDDGGVYEYHDPLLLNGLTCRNGKRILVQDWVETLLPPEYYPKNINSVGGL